MAIRVGVVWIPLCLDDSKVNADDARADDARSEPWIGRPKQLPPLVERVVCYFCEDFFVVNALLAQRALPLAGDLPTHAFGRADTCEVCAVKNHAQTELRRRWSLYSRLRSTAWQWSQPVSGATSSLA